MVPISDTVTMLDTIARLKPGSNAKLKLMRKRDEVDRRRMIVKITRAGRAKLVKADAAAGRIEDELLGPIDDELLARLADGLR